MDNIQEPSVVVRQLGAGLGGAWICVYYDPITSKVCILEEQLKKILNFDETCMSMGGSTQNRGGRPEVILYDPRFPQVGKATSKSSLTSTMTPAAMLLAIPSLLTSNFKVESAV